MPVLHWPQIKQVEQLDGASAERAQTLGGTHLAPKNEEIEAGQSKQGTKKEVRRQTKKSGKKNG